MRRSDKAAGRFGLVLLVVALVVAALYFTGWGAIIKNVAVLAWRGNAMVNLAKRTPFTPPSAGIVPEERLQAYLDVCDRIKPAGDKIDEWEAAHARAGSKLVFKGSAAGLVENFIDQFNLALQQQRMGPEEFAWIEGRMRRAGGPASQTEPQSDRLLCAKYRDRLARSALGPHAKRIALGFAD